MYIELKATVTLPDIERIIYEIYRCDMEKCVSVISFDFEQLEMFRHMNSSIILGKLLLPTDFNIERMVHANISLACAPYQAFFQIPQLLQILRSNNINPNANGITKRNIVHYFLRQGINILGCDKAL